MRRLLLCALLVGVIGGLSGCDDKKTAAVSLSGTGTGPRTGAGPDAPPPPPPPPPPK
jgi:hypothetical protein